MILCMTRCEPLTVHAFSILITNIVNVCSRLYRRGRCWAIRWRTSRAIAEHQAVRAMTSVSRWNQLVTSAGCCSVWDISSRISRLLLVVAGTCLADLAASSWWRLCADRQISAKWTCDINAYAECQPWMYYEVSIVSTVAQHYSNVEDIVLELKVALVCSTKHSLSSPSRGCQWCIPAIFGQSGKIYSLKVCRRCCQMQGCFAGN